VHIASGETAQKLLREKFRFLLDLKVECVSLTTQVADMEDDLLRRFTAGAAGGQYRNSSSGVVIDFSIAKSGAGRPIRESRGYINRGWQVLERKRHW
jgi:hypothetical protein